jgi:hypothetical protein
VRCHFRERRICTDLSMNTGGLALPAAHTWLSVAALNAKMYPVLEVRPVSGPNAVLPW